MKGIVYFCNGIGNLVMMMPAMQAVASLTDDEKIDVVLGDWHDNRKPAIMEILDTWPVVDKVFVPPYKFNPNRYDLWFHSYHGSNTEVVNVFKHKMTHKPVAKPAWKSSMMHEVDHYMEIAYAMGYQGPVPRIDFPVSSNPDLSELKRPIIGICNGYFNVGYWEKKAWPNFAQFVEVAKRYFGGTVVGIGSMGELTGVGLDEQMDFSGRATILQTSKIISQMDVLVTSDTGNMHIADAMNVPVVTLFGSTLISKNGPRGDKAMILSSGVECAPCQDTGRFYTCKDYVCMRSINVGDVVSVVRHKLSGGK
ncbi:MAG: glycosyltransferase family 9 protein [Sphaerochaeta sp.]|nr:glycosyltransferase family 9 protein [Sphaerochaeta sp.]